MKLSISNIAWDKSLDDEMYEYLKSLKFEGLEIAPTRIFEESPYDKLREAKEFSSRLKKKYDLNICSMQSIWYGKNQNLFGSPEEREDLILYTKKAIDFSSVMGCNNLVFGCPRNRNIKASSQYGTAVEFFNVLGDYAHDKDTIIAIEPNPTIYNTNFINYTNEAFNFVKDINNRGIKVNVDLGTIIHNKEDIASLNANIDMINHVHISEPGLNEIHLNKLHDDLSNMLKTADYNNYVSIEMKNLNDIDTVKSIMYSVKDIFR